jgi:ribosome-binding protein aMBF1 (putative translation factor)
VKAVATGGLSEQEVAAFINVLAAVIDNLQNVRADSNRPVQQHLEASR